MSLFRKQKYLAYETADGRIKTVHSRVAEKKYGYDKIPEGFVVHHIDGNKDNNRYSNLMLLHRKDHFRIHKKKDLKIESVRGM